MTKKKYILIFITFFLLLVLCLFLFTFGLYFKENNLNLFILFMICAIIFFIASIIFIGINYKKLIIYEKNKLSEKMKHIDFIYFDSSISDKEHHHKIHLLHHGVQPFRPRMRDPHDALTHASNHSNDVPQKQSPAPSRLQSSAPLYPPDKL